MTQSLRQHPSWTSRWTFIFAATGSAVGLGNIWKFPYITGENGGGAFVLVYLACILIIGVPAMMSEIMLGRASRSNPISGMRRLALDSDKSALWSLVGVMGVITGIMILSFYSVVASWALDYVYAFSVKAVNTSNSSSAEVHFANLLSNSGQLIKMHTAFIILTGLVIVFGVVKGIGLAVRTLMPLLFILLAILVIYSIQHGDFSAGFSFLFSPNFSKLSASSVLVALGHAFFTLSLGMGAIMTYGSYMPANASIAKTALIIVLTDTVVALMAGMVIFPLVFAYGLEASSGPSLLFISMPLAFDPLPYSRYFAIFFFVLVSIAAWSSAISIIEPAVSWLEKRGLHRSLGTVLLCSIAWLGGYWCIQSNNWSGTGDEPRRVFEWLDYIASNIMLPLGGLLICIFAGWKLRRKLARNQFSELSETQFNIWYALTRVIAPTGIIIIFIQISGLYDIIRSFF